MDEIVSGLQWCFTGAWITQITRMGDVCLTGIESLRGVHDTGIPKEKTSPAAK